MQFTQTSTIDNKKSLKRLVSVGLVAIAVNPSLLRAADEDKMKLYGDFRLRYETVSQNNALDDADALTLRSRLGIKTASINGFSAVAELENTIELVEDFSVPPAGVRPGEFSVIADPESAEIDQAYIKYSANGFTAKFGRQVLTLDGHRFVGHVGWRQDRQTFDGITVSYKADDFVLNASYIDKRNRIFADEADLDAKDMLLNTSYKTSYGKFAVYAYLLEVDNASDDSLDIYGVSFNGKSALGESKLSYKIEYATQEANDVFDTKYLALEGALGISGITAKVGYEVLGSDDGQKGFATPLATLHKFNGWADQFLGTPIAGLEDLYLGLSGNAAGGKWAAIYHNYSSDVGTEGGDDLGDEINLVYSRKFGDDFSGGVKLANYSAGDVAFNKVDTDKVWLWAGYKF